MNDRSYKWILYTIITVIITTIGIQVYWNYKNYQTNKQQLVNDVQISLDKAVDNYYATIAEQTASSFIIQNNANGVKFSANSSSQFRIEKDSTKSEFINLVDSLKFDKTKSVEIFNMPKGDSTIIEYSKDFIFTLPPDSLDFGISNFTHNYSFETPDVKQLTSKVLISMMSNNIDLKRLDSLVNIEFERKNLSIDSKLYFDEGKLNRKPPLLLNDSILNKNGILSTTSKSLFLPKGSTLLIGFKNVTLTILKRILSGILISTLLILAVISCLFYLLKIIKHQKQIAEVKNDLISNITHEFKTPIATIGVALESITNFNGIDDKAKTKKYINMSAEQLGKLNIMVEKLLETATLDSDRLELNKDTIDIVELISTLINRYKIQFPDKTFKFNFNVERLNATIDVFHFENALNNILDNAVKYGGYLISVDVNLKDKNIDILISDNGNSLTKANKDRVFEKFYRVPKGNTHNVKGFGIGLYYTKTIIKKHKGLIALELNKNLTTFKITLPNG